MKTEHVLETLEKDLRDAVRKRRTIVVGPWFEEVGLELLYWVPFVRWAVQRFEVPPEQLLIVSRGGTASWYGALAGRYTDVFSLVSFDEFKTAQGEPFVTVIPESTSLSEMKREVDRRINDFLSECLRRVEQAEQPGRLVQLHPKVMKALLRAFWKGEAAVDSINPYLVYERISPPAHRAAESLPAEFIAARFYASNVMPPSAENRASIRHIVDELTPMLPVVLLEQPFSVDEHADFSHLDGQRVFDASMPLPDNLTAQTAVIGRSRLFVATYGGLSYLAPLCGVPAVGVHPGAGGHGWPDQLSRLNRAHLDAARNAFQRLGVEDLYATIGATDTPDEIAPVFRQLLANGRARNRVESALSR